MYCQQSISKNLLNIIFSLYTVPHSLNYQRGKKFEASTEAILYGFFFWDS